MKADEAITQARLLAADAIGELMGFWNFKPSMGRVWTVLYLSMEPLTAEEIAERAQLSTGSVSMTVQGLLRWGVIRRAGQPGSRRRRYEAETDVLAMVTHVFQERELRLVGDVIRRLEEAQRILEQGSASGRSERGSDRRFLVTRIRNLLGLARMGQRLIKGFSKAGHVDLGGIRDALIRRVQRDV